jgi:hypothetical protein
MVLDAETKYVLWWWRWLCLSFTLKLYIFQNVMRMPPVFYTVVTKRNIPVIVNLFLHSKEIQVFNVLWISFNQSP